MDMNIKNKVVKAYFVTEQEVVPYNPKIHRRRVSKFQCWVDGDKVLLLASPLMPDLKMAAHPYFFTQVFFRNSRYEIPKRKPDGAGENAKGDIRWFSIELDVDTPVELQPIIREVLGI